jgi:hypothetical protein
VDAQFGGFAEPRRAPVAPLGGRRAHASVERARVLPKAVHCPATPIAAEFGGAGRVSLESRPMSVDTIF